MTNRSKLDMPSFYSPAAISELSETVYCPRLLEIFDISYLHFHSVLELGICEQGSGVCMLEGEEQTLREGDVQIIFPFQNHFNRSAGANSKWSWISLNPLKQLGGWGAPDLPRLERKLYGEMGLCGVIDGDRFPLIAELARRIVHPGDSDRRLSCLCTLIEELAAESKGMPTLKLRPNRNFERLEPALRRVQEDLEQGVITRVSDMAEQCALSPAAFRRAFGLAMGQSPQQYVQTCQLRKAQRLLLLTDASVTDVALAVGYQDVSGFNRQFLRAFGMAPRRYRQCGGTVAEK